ncbi:hypothetical protein HK100_002347 [Physocladia obscura]|uniref:Fungal lipase-type domain-containing protein n=1 Tax=Physocladia obscura TaxID=109957 RepID=A0AAD5SVJ4_9FUNG|nr:hypothetical protein HK100_002347 [Physocladia obscura]
MNSNTPTQVQPNPDPSNSYLDKKLIDDLSATDCKDALLKLGNSSSIVNALLRIDLKSIRAVLVAQLLDKDWNRDMWQEEEQKYYFSTVDSRDKKDGDMILQALLMSAAVYEEDPLHSLTLRKNDHTVATIRVVKRRRGLERYLIGFSRDKKKAWIAFKGTSEMDHAREVDKKCIVAQFFIINTTLHPRQALKVGVVSVSQDRGGREYSVHNGYQSIIRQLPRLIEKLMEEGAMEIIVCGHSRGGALAHLFVLDFLLRNIKSNESNVETGVYILPEKFDCMNIRSIAFGSPYVVNEPLAQFVRDSNLSKFFTTVVNGHDLVPIVLNIIGQGMLSSQIKSSLGNLDGGGHFITGLETALPLIAGKTVTSVYKAVLTIVSKYFESAAGVYRPIGHYIFLKKSMISYHPPEVITDNDITFKRFQELARKNSENSLKDHVVDLYRSAIKGSYKLLKNCHEDAWFQYETNPRSLDEPESPNIIHISPTKENSALKPTITRIRGSVCEISDGQRLTFILFGNHLDLIDVEAGIAIEEEKVTSDPVKPSSDNVIDTDNGRAMTISVDIGPNSQITYFDGAYAKLIVNSILEGDEPIHQVIDIVASSKEMSTISKITQADVAQLANIAVKRFLVLNDDLIRQKIKQHLLNVDLSCFPLNQATKKGPHTIGELLDKHRQTLDPNEKKLTFEHLEKRCDLYLTVACSPLPVKVDSKVLKVSLQVADTALATFAFLFAGGLLASVAEGYLVAEARQIVAAFGGGTMGTTVDDGLKHKEALIKKNKYLILLDTLSEWMAVDRSTSNLLDAFSTEHSMVRALEERDLSGDMLMHLLNSPKPGLSMNVPNMSKLLGSSFAKDGKYGEYVSHETLEAILHRIMIIQRVHALRQLIVNMTVVAVMGTQKVGKSIGSMLLFPEVMQQRERLNQNQTGQTKTSAFEAAGLTTHTKVVTPYFCREFIVLDFPGTDTTEQSLREVMQEYHAAASICILFCFCNGNPSEEVLRNLDRLGHWITMIPILVCAHQAGNKVNEPNADVGLLHHVEISSKEKVSEIENAWKETIYEHFAKEWDQEKENVQLPNLTVRLTEFQKNRELCKKYGIWGILDVRDWIRTEVKKHNPAISDDKLDEFLPDSLSK